MQKLIFKLALGGFVIFLCNASKISVAESYQIDPAHTLLQFSVERFGMIEVAGKFKDFSGEVHYDESENIVMKANITIEVSSLDTDHEVRDGHLKSEIWLDAVQYPQITFALDNPIAISDGAGTASGQLTLHGTTQNVSFPIVFKGPFVDPTKKKTISLSGDLSIDRQDYGISFSKFIDDNIPFIGNEVQIKIRALAHIP